MRNPAVFRPLAFAAASVLLAGCGSAPPHSEAAAPATGAASHYPFTVDNCGTKVTFTAAPARVVTIKSTTTEMLLALGLGSRIAGSAFADGPVPQQWRQDVPVLSAQLPAQEPVLELEPDLVYAGWESNFSADGAGERPALGRLGINTYVSPAACQEPGYQPDPLTFEDIFAQVREVGRIFDAGTAAEQLVADQRDRLAAVRANGKGLTALWYSSGSDIPFVGGGIGAPELVMEAAGLKNIAAGSDKTWLPMSWEVVAERNPDVIVLVDSSWSSVQKKIGVLEAHPVISQLDAVRKHRYLVVPFAASEAGVRSVDTVESLVRQLAELD